jgi:BirA family transcriptional regulator, biotin operon repressor / biotin---[acetyl-CoA-carboxylase] ligase
MRKFEVLDATGSTNSDLLGRPFVDFKDHPMRNGESPQPNEQVLLAWQQTAGRGQRGRQWHSNTQQSLTFSMSLDGNANAIVLDGFSLFVGLCVVEGIDQWWQEAKAANEHWPIEHTLPLKLKWPNDVVSCSEQGLLKVGGVLIETKTQGTQMRLVIGVGVNVLGDFGALTRDLNAGDLIAGGLNEIHALRPTALLPVARSDLNPLDSKSLRRQLALKISEVFFSHWPVFADRGFAAYQKAYQAQHVLHNQTVQWLENEQWQFGVCTGVALDGALKVRTQKNTIRSLYSSSISVRLREEKEAEKP